MDTHIYKSCMSDAICNKLCEGITNRLKTIVYATKSTAFDEILFSKSSLKKRALNDDDLCQLSLTHFRYFKTPKCTDSWSTCKKKLRGSFQALTKIINPMLKAIESGIYSIETLLGVYDTQLMPSGCPTILRNWIGKGKMQLITFLLDVVFQNLCHK